MNYGPLLFLGVFLSFALSWSGMILAPQLQIGTAPLATVENGQVYPSIRPGEANQGKEIYRSLGCAACHTQQVRDNDVPVLGPRFSVAQDYLRDQPVLVGSQRIGPDLMNVGLRQPDKNWHLLHLYDPQITSPGSTMPTYKFLFVEKKIKGAASTNALALPEKFSKAGVEVFPKQEAIQLAAYLQSLQAGLPLYEAPLPKSAQKKSTNTAPESATNAPAGDTNAAPQTNAPTK